MRATVSYLLMLQKYQFKAKDSEKTIMQRV